MRDSETLLFIYNQQSQIVKLNVLAEQTVRSDQNIDLPFAYVLQSLFHFCSRSKAAYHIDLHREHFKSFAERVVMLKCKNRGWSKHRHLFAIADCFERGAHRNFRFAV